MTIYPVTAPEFAPYGRVITGYETECEAVVAALSACICRAYRYAAYGDGFTV